MIVIPMAGNSSRFFKEGYTVPKYELNLFGKSLFTLSVKSFESYFHSEFFLFILRKEFNSMSFVENECKKVGIKNFKIIDIDAKETHGQAETVALGLKKIPSKYLNDNLFIFNIDTIRLNYIFPSDFSLWDGYLEVFIGKGDNWSFIFPDNSEKYKVKYTTEKKRVSDFCSTGLYYFKSSLLFQEALNQAYEDETFLLKWNEYYISPLYNYLIKKGYKIYFNLIDNKDVKFSGTPKEYEALLVEGTL